MENEEKIIIDHDQIKQWIKRHGGKPAVIDDPEAGSDKKGIRIDFPTEKDEALLSEERSSRDITWDEFFQIFENEHLAFIIKNEDIDDPTLSYAFIDRRVLGKE